jgi:hypothetical protein
MSDQEAIAVATRGYDNAVLRAANQYHADTGALTDAWALDTNADDGAYLASVAPRRAVYERIIAQAGAEYIAAVQAASGG